jgi:hypothetical protein
MCYFKNYVFQYTNKNSDCLLLDLTAIGTKNAEKGFLNHGTHRKHGKKVLTTKNAKNTKKRTHPNKPNAIFGLISDKFG